MGERMVEEAEKYKNEDEKTRLNIEAKNSLENYTYNIKNTIKDEKLKDKITDSEKDEKENELKNLANPIITKMYQQGSKSNMGDAGEGQANETSGPKIEEVD